MFSFQVIYEISEKQICCLGGCLFYEEMLEPTARETEKYQFSQTAQDDFIQFLIKLSQSRQNNRRNELPAATTIPTQVVFINHTEYITLSYHSGSLGLSHKIKIPLVYKSKLLCLNVNWVKIKVKHVSLSPMLFTH